MNKLWVVRKQPYRETSALLTVLLGENRLIRCIARGGGKVSEFNRYLVCWQTRKGSLVYRRLNRRVQGAALGRRTYQRFVYERNYALDDSRGRRG